MAVRVGSATAGRVDELGVAETAGVGFAHTITCLVAPVVNLRDTGGLVVNDALAGCLAPNEAAAALLDGRADAFAGWNIINLRRRTGLVGSAPAGGIYELGVAAADRVFPANTIADLIAPRVQAGNASGSGVSDALACAVVPDEPASALLDEWTNTLTDDRIVNLGSRATGVGRAATSGIHELGSAQTVWLSFANAVAGLITPAMQTRNARGSRIGHALAD